jgi:hypothetical protein
MLDLNKLQWHFAKTMPEIPHEYVVKGRDLSAKDWDELANTIRILGELRMWKDGKRYRYWIPGDGYRYWVIPPSSTDVKMSHEPMRIDTSFDFRTDASGRDPDKYSPTLKQYHKLLWSKPLPSGRPFDLSDAKPRVYLYHQSDLGEFSLSSDTLIPHFEKRKSLRHIVFSAEETEALRRVGYTIGGMIVFPGNQIDRKPTIIAARGLHWKIRDRFDLTLECIRRHYLGGASIGQSNPLGDVLSRYRDFFNLFECFRGYVDFFLLNDLVKEDCSKVKFFLPFDDFSTPALPMDRATYEHYRQCSIEFVKARNRSID